MIWLLLSVAPLIVLALMGAFMVLARFCIRCAIELGDDLDYYREWRREIRNR